MQQIFNHGDSSHEVRILVDPLLNPTTAVLNCGVVTPSKLSPEFWKGQTGVGPRQVVRDLSRPGEGALA